MESCISIIMDSMHQFFKVRHVDLLDGAFIAIRSAVDAKATPYINGEMGCRLLEVTFTEIITGWERVTSASAKRRNARWSIQSYKDVSTLMQVRDKFAREGARAASAQEGRHWLVA